MPSNSPLFDPSRFDPARSALPRVEQVRSIGRATDVVIGLVTIK